jgi:hypothetical protein
MRERGGGVHKKQKNKGVKTRGLLLRLQNCYHANTHSSTGKIQVLTYTDLRFEQVWRGETWRTHTFPRMPPIKNIAEKLHCTEASLRKALLAGKTNFQQWDIVHN